MLFLEFTKAVKAGESYAGESVRFSKYNLHPTGIGAGVGEECDMRE
jgi:hypothetical protein